MTGGAVTGGARVTSIRRLFVANRGEIAARVSTTARRLGIEPIVPVARGEGGGTDGLDLLDPAAIVAAALAADADAIHPGYGFLAESPALAGAVAAAGLRWVGPPADAIALLGDKALARGTAQAAGVPVAAGETPEDQSDGGLAAAAERIGLPLIVKPAAGGGGKGIRIVRAMADLAPALAGARREAVRAFADGRLILERYVAPARHVEVQVLVDEHGGVVHLGERDCSLQRRHQKVLEEAPAPGLDLATRASLRAAAVEVARAAGYRNAGTCEFLVGDDGAWVFMEMNARLQVEHPVTELITGVDLVEAQLRIAEGARLADLGLEQAAIEARLATGGHAVEVRLNAEDPAAGFVPGTGEVVLALWPAGSRRFDPTVRYGVRVDAVLDVGDAVTGAFDPLVAKVIAHGPDRRTGLARLAAALDETELLGLPTNLAFLRRLVREPVVAAGEARTTTLEALAAEPTGPAAALVPDAAAWAEAARRLALGGPRREEQDTGTAWTGGWRLNAPAALRLVAGLPPDVLTVTVAVPASADPGAAPTEAPPAAGPVSGVVFVSVSGASVPVRLAPPPDQGEAAAGARHAGAGGADLVAPMPGVVVAVHVADGAAVAAGGRVVTIEAMKMEHAVTAATAGTVVGLACRPGDRVERGQVLARLEAGS